MHFTKNGKQCNQTKEFIVNEWQAANELLFLFTAVTPVCRRHLGDITRIVDRYNDVRWSDIELDPPIVME